MDLNSLKYADLQQLAKSVGLKANMKADKLLKALKIHFKKQESSENGNHVTFDDSKTLARAVEHMPPKGELVTMRCGKAQNTKRKRSGEPSTKIKEIQVQGNVELTAAEDGGKRSSKRRKRSSSRGTQAPTLSEKPEENQLIVKPASTTNDAAEESNKVVKSVGKIPRHEGLMKKAALRPTTPNFKKLHEAHFQKMESIDSYVQRRNKQMEVLRNSVKELKTPRETSVKKPAQKKTRRPMQATNQASLLSPAVPEKKDKRKITPSRKSALKNSAPFRPSVFSTNRINVRFSRATQDNEHKQSLVKTPARMSPILPLTPTPGRKSEALNNKSTGTVNKTPGVTPFIFNASSETPGTNKKNTFDLKASLSRPLNYKPHKGKLKPFGATEENVAPNRMQTVASHQKNYKQHQVQTRQGRRIKHTEGRKQKKEQMLGARRGILMA